jgi:beta-lactamase class A
MQHKKRLLQGVGGIIVLIILGQLLYPGARLLPFTQIDMVSVGGWQKADASRELDHRYSEAKMGVYFGKAAEAYRSPKPADIKLEIRNQQRIDALQYPWYLRLLPGSIVWAHLVVKPAADPQYIYAAEGVKTYVNKELGESCSVEPKNASFKLAGSKLEVVSSSEGGTCDIATVITKLSEVKVRITGGNRAVIPVKVINPTIDNDKAEAVVRQLNSKFSAGVAITSGATTSTVSPTDVLSWIDPVEADSALTFTFSSERASGYLNQHIAPGVAVKPGVSKVTTQDFMETARVDGTPGRALDIAATLQQLKEYAEAKRTTVTAATRVVPPTVEYTRSYSPTDTGLSALLKHYAESHPGTYGISLIELSDKRRRAAFQDDKQFTTASTYKLFVAYSSLKRVEEGAWQWSDQIQGGRNLEKCFDDMIVRSDNACAEALLQKIGFKAATSEIQALGLTNTTFLKGDTPLTTAGDLSLFNAMLQSNQLLSQQASRDRLINAMKRNIYRQGIPAGTGNQVADKVGFLDGLFHDAAIVYGPSGPYVLTIMSEGSNWATIADLTRQIEALRNQ